jgi:hypothetical protein
MECLLGVKDEVISKPPAQRSRLVSAHFRVGLIHFLVSVLLRLPPHQARSWAIDCTFVAYTLQNAVSESPGIQSFQLKN